MSADDDLDLILVGGGLANSLIAWRLAVIRPEVRFAVVEREGRFGGRHTWSFFDGDVSEADRAWLAPAVAHRWEEGYDVHFPNRSRTLRTPYNSLTSDRLDAALKPLIGDRLVTSEVVAVTPTSVQLSDQRVLTARGVIDARGPGPSPELQLGWQVFLGQVLRLEQPHGLTRPTIMDATVAQHGAYRFVYLLPFDETTVLVEDTYYADGPGLDRPAIRDRIAAYAVSRGWKVAEIVEEEEGVLPIALDGDMDAFWASGAEGVARAGLSAALFHPTTGYSLPDAVETSRRVAEVTSFDGANLRRLLEDHSRRTWRERGFYRLLDRMLFRAAEPGERWRVLERFYGLSEGVVRRFYAGRSTALDKARILAGKPPVPIGKAMRELRETGEGQTP